MRIVVGHDNEGQWWWTAIAENGAVVAKSAMHGSRSDCMHSIAELKVEGPAAAVYDDSVDDVPLPALRRLGL